jgi:hypothetical protein
MNVANNGECTGFNGLGTTDTARYGKDPLVLDRAGNPIGLDTVQCGRTESGVFPQVQSYCASSGDNLISGWGKRRYEWQIGIGVQHEILPRLSGEVTYNRRLYRNLTVQDQLGLGCDRYNGATDHDACVNAMLAYSSPTYDFYTVKAPTDPRLPGGGGYTIIGNADQRVAIPRPVLSGTTPIVQRGELRSELELLLARHRHQLRLARAVGLRKRRHQSGHTVAPCAIDGGRAERLGPRR